MLVTEYMVEKHCSIYALTYSSITNFSEAQGTSWVTRVSSNYKKNVYKKMSLKNLKKMLRKSPASNAWASILKNADFS